MDAPVRCGSPVAAAAAIQQQRHRIPAGSLSFPSHSSTGCWPASPGLPGRGSSGYRCQRRPPCPAPARGERRVSRRWRQDSGSGGAAGSTNPPPPPRPCLQAPAPPAGPVGAFGAAPTACPCSLLAGGRCCGLAATRGEMLRMSRCLQAAWWLGLGQPTRERLLVSRKACQQHTEVV